jgi:hypothetical protein
MACHALDQVRKPFDRIRPAGVTGSLRCRRKTLGMAHEIREIRAETPLIHIALLYHPSPAGAGEHQRVRFLVLV